MVIKRFAIFESLFMLDTLITYANPRCMQGACSLDYGRVSVAHW